MKAVLNERGLIPAIAQDVDTGQVLMLGYMSPGSLKRTLDEGQVWFFSRSRGDLWHKGELSGNYMNVKDVHLDCDGDSVLLKVKPEGPACHTGQPTCFFTSLDMLPDSFEGSGNTAGVLEELFALIQDRKLELPEGSYTTSLLKAGLGRISQKVIEEAGETAIAAVQEESENLPEEVADLFYHLLVLLASSGVSLSRVWEVLRSRQE